MLRLPRLRLPALVMRGTISRPSQRHTPPRWEVSSEAVGAERPSASPVTEALRRDGSKRKTSEGWRRAVARERRFVLSDAARAAR